MSRLLLLVALWLSFISSIFGISCGNGVIESGELCDDGNTAGRDGCTFCQVDGGYVCTGQPSYCVCREHYYQYQGVCTYCMRNETCNNHGDCFIDGSCQCEISGSIAWVGPTCSQSYNSKGNFSVTFDVEKGVAFDIVSTSTDSHKFIFPPKSVVSLTDVTLRGYVFAPDALPANKKFQPNLLVASDVIVFADENRLLNLFSPAEVYFSYPFSTAWSDPPTMLRLYRYEALTGLWTRVPGGGVDVSHRIVDNDQIRKLGTFAICNNTDGDTRSVWSYPVPASALSVKAIALIFFGCVAFIIAVSCFLCLGRKAYKHAVQMKLKKESDLEAQFKALTQRPVGGTDKIRSENFIGTVQDADAALDKIAGPIARRRVELEDLAGDNNSEITAISQAKPRGLMAILPSAALPLSNLWNNSATPPPLPAKTSLPLPPLSLPSSLNPLNLDPKNLIASDSTPTKNSPPNAFAALPGNISHRSFHDGSVSHRSFHADAVSVLSLPRSFVRGQSSVVGGAASTVSETSYLDPISRIYQSFQTAISDGPADKNMKEIETKEKGKHLVWETVNESGNADPQVEAEIGFENYIDFEDVLVDDIGTVFAKTALPPPDPLPPPPPSVLANADELESEENKMYNLE